jgi:hypothetical protein
LKFLLSGHIPPFDRVLLVESGSRYLLEHLIPGIYANHSELERLDIVTCFPGQPSTFNPARGRIWRVTDYPGKQNRSKLYAELAEAGHSVTGVICSGEDIMTKWKLVLGWKTRGKVFILNENGDYFWFDRENWATIRHFALYRMGLSGAGAVTTILQLLVFPFTLTYLLSFAAYVNLRRYLRS